MSETTTTTKKNNNAKGSTKNAKPKVSEVKQEAIDNIPENISQDMIIIVKNGFHGQMVYTSPKTGETFFWNAFGDEQEMELRELRNAKNAHKNFFVNNWFMFDDENAWVIKYLGLTQYYKHTVSEEGFEELLSKKLEDIPTIIGAMSSGQKESLIYMIREKVTHGEIDSLKLINVLEDCLGVAFIEK